MFSSALSAGVVDIVIFSYDRPMQLFACLESIEKYFSSVNEIHVIYRTSNPAYDAAYALVWGRFSYVKPVRQGKNPQADFKPLTIAAVASSPCPYIMFAVDDIIVTDFVNLSACVTSLETYKAWGFFLRLGKNITYAYSSKKNTPIPVGKDLSGNLFLWQFPKGVSNWGYPNSLDMTIYRKKNLHDFFEKENFTNPNTFEGIWDTKYASYTQMGLCYLHSKIVNIPMNIVQPTCHNPVGHIFTPTELLCKFQAGLKIDITQFYKYENHSPQEEARPRFIPRKFGR
jgi:hypothetical protein